MTPSPWLQQVGMVCLATLFVAALLTLYRMKLGPKAADRAIALDTLAMVFMGIISVVCVTAGTSLYFDAVWILSLIGFLGTAAIAKYLEKGRIF